jgi:hypothetical protein
MPPLNDFSELVSELNVAQHDLWLKENGWQPHLLFDTADVRRALLGANEYISWQDSTSMAVNVSEFEKPPVLVACLMAAMFLGPFSMLPPHQAELLRQLRGDEAFVKVPRKLDQTTFLMQVGIDSRWGTDDTDEDVLRATLKRHAGAKTERFFKAVQCIGMPWWERLKKLTGTGMFVAGTAEFDYSTLLKRQEMPRLLSAFKSSRPNSLDHLVTRNNFADAVSLLMLIDLVSRFKKGQSKTVPRFFDSTGLFARVAREAGVVADLMIVSDGLKSSALVSAKSLIYAASLKSRNEEAAPFLAKLKEAVEGLGQNSGDAQRLDDLVRRLIPSLGSQLREVIDLSFLEGVWLQTVALDELRDIRKRWVADSAITDHFRGVVDQTVEASLQDVLSGAHNYKYVSNAWIGLRHELLIWRRKQLERRARSPEFQLDVGMFRFGPRLAMIERVRAGLEIFVDDQLEDEQVTGLTAWHDLLGCCMDLEGTRPTSDTISSAEFVAGTLWAIQAYEKLIEFLRRHVASPGTAFIVKIIYLAAMLRLGRDLWKVENDIEALCTDLKARRSAASTQEEVLAELMVHSSSVAYLWFHLWRAKSILPPYWRSGGAYSPAAGAQQSPNGSTSKHLREAIEYVEMACDCAQRVTSTDNHTRERQICVANQRLYYLVEEGAESRIEDMELAYDKLAGYLENAREFWQPTYYDTLARYWAFMAYRATAETTWASFLDHAKRHFKQAAAAEESEVKTFGGYLTKVEAVGFQPRAKPPASSAAVPKTAPS